MPTLTESLNENFNFFIKEDLHRFKGEWVAIINKNVIDSGDDLKTLAERVKDEYPEEEPFIVRAPTGKALIL